jgi:hypothetical protein
MKGVGVLMCLLGSTWISGLLYLVINSLYLAYAFTILNSLQGMGTNIQSLFTNKVIPTVGPTYTDLCILPDGLKQKQFLLT